MTDTTITHAPSTSIPAPARTPNRRKGAAAVAAGLAFAALAGAAALVAVSGSDSTDRPAVASAERSVLAEAGASISADAAERAALLELSGRTDACRATIVAPDSLERCIGHGDG